MCDWGWGGLDCSGLDEESFCASNCTTGYGVFVNSSGTCLCSDPSEIAGGLCPWNCSGHGACTNGTCACDLGYMGLGCNLLSAAAGRSGDECMNNCTGNGACINGTCLCDNGWSGDDCSFAPVHGGGCPGNCSGYGACLNGTCFCDPGWMGPACDMKVSEAQPCAFNCSSHGVCMNATCFCDPGFTGSYCELFGPSATPMPIDLFNASQPLPCGGDLSCSERGTCVDGTCVCDAGYVGPSCETRVSIVQRACLNHCNQHGACLNGTCICDVAWDGPDCSYPSLCPGFSPQVGVNCSGHGHCLNGTCVCDRDWVGSDCGSAACVGSCSGHGICANGTCACDAGWGGEACLDVNCPNSCSGHGTCEGTLGTLPQCVCDSGWGGADCGYRVCPTSEATSNPYIPCSGNGGCAQNGTCLCYENYAGDDCSILIDCTSRGIRRCGFCRCEDGFTGENCENDVCADSRIWDPAFPTDPAKSTVCSGRGRCTTTGGCVCDQGWAGKNCSKPAVCPNNCNGRGTCSGSRDSPGKCSCEKYDIADTPFDTIKYSGASCEIRQCPGYTESQGAGVQCGGKGVCQTNQGYTCTCFNEEGRGVYGGVDCLVPPGFFVQDVQPKVSPLEGGTIVTIFGPGIERLIPQNPQGVFCDFEAPTRTQARVGPAANTMICPTPPQNIASQSGVKVALYTFTGNKLITGVGYAGFEYFVMNRVRRLMPTFAPLRPVGVNRGPPDVNRPNILTVTGTYFPPAGTYVCRFGDCESVIGTRVDQATITCTMPTLAKPGQMLITVASEAQTFSPPQGREALYTVFGITRITPMCGGQTGVAIATVSGQYLVDPEDPNRNPNRFFCRFGRISLSGLTKNNGIPYQPGYQVYAYHSPAIISTEVPGALTCRVPDWTVEVDNFALTLDSEYKANANVPTDGYYVGPWDSAPGVTFRTYFPPEIGPHPSSPYVIAPTIGSIKGGTRVTISGYGFDYARYGPNNGIVPFEWISTKPRCNPAPIPACRFGLSVSTRVELISDSMIVCISAPLIDPITEPKTVVIEVALDGQTYSAKKNQFQYAPVPQVDRIHPTAGIATGGTSVTVFGKEFVDSSPGENGAAPRVLSCVFISKRDSSDRAVAPAVFISPEEIVCEAPRMISSPQTVIVDVSISGQPHSSQLTGSEEEYLFYQDPTLTRLVDSIGPYYGGDQVRVEGGFFVNLPTLACRFGTEIVAGTFVTAQAILCDAPPVDEAQVVNVEVSMNLLDWTAFNLTYNYYKVTSMQPSSGPVHGGTFVRVRFDGGDNFDPTGPTMRYSMRFRRDLPVIGPEGEVEEVLQSIAGRYVPVQKYVEFFIPKGYAPEPAATTYEAQFAVTVTEKYHYFAPYSFVFYEVGLESIIPCKTFPCDYVILPHNELDYPITFTGRGFVDVDTIQCAFIPIVGQLREDTLAAQGDDEFGEFRTVDANTPWPPPGVQVDFSPGDLVEKYDQNDGWIGAVGCTVPPHMKKEFSPTEPIAYYASMALNGQNWDHEVYTVIFMPQPNMTSISRAASRNDDPRYIEITATDWQFPQWLKPASVELTPETLSVLFFSPTSGEYLYIPAENATCVDGECRAMVKTPSNVRTSDVDSVQMFQVFLSLNSRDPCIQCGCADRPVNIPAVELEAFARDKCLSKTVLAMWDTVTDVSVYDESTGGYCPDSPPRLSHVLFCGSTQGCPARSNVAPGNRDFYYGCLGESAYERHMIYETPVVHVLSPAAVGEVNNQTILVTASGEGFRTAMWAEWPWLDTEDPLCATTGKKVAFTVRLYYMQNGKDTFEVVLHDAAYYDDCAKNVQLHMPLPCSSDSNDKCSHAPFYNFNQTELKMSVGMAFSFDGGEQYTEMEHVVQVYKFKDCPTTGCGHGSCIEDSNGMRYCECGRWAVGCGEQQTRSYIDDTLLPATITSQLGRFYGTYAQRPWISDERQNELGATSDLACTAGPRIISILPTTGTITGDTLVTVTLSMFEANPGWENFPPASYYKCFFGDCNANSSLSFVREVNMPRIKETHRIYQCRAPQVSEGGSVELTVSMVNVGEKKSQADFGPGVDFKYYAIASVKSVSIVQGQNLIEGPLFANVTAPICDAPALCPLCPLGSPDCLERFRLRVNGTGFEDTRLIGCRFTDSFGGVQYTRAAFISSRQIDCDIPSGDESTLAGATRLAITLDGQIYTPSMQSPPIFFYEQPRAVQGDVGVAGSSLYRGFGVDPGELPVDFRSTDAATQDKYYQLAPVEGGTPLVMYVAEHAQTGSVVEFSGMGKLSLRFGTCQSTCVEGTETNERFGKSCEYPELDDPEEQFCTCDVGPTVDVALDGQAGSYQGKQVHKLRVETPEALAGKYMMCFSMNKAYYLPLQANRIGGIGLERLFFRFYPKPMVTGLSIIDGPINVCGSTATDPSTYQACTKDLYTVKVYGANFLQDPKHAMCGQAPCSETMCVGGGGISSSGLWCSTCVFSEVGVCGDYAPSSVSGGDGDVQIFVRIDGSGFHGPAVADFATVGVMSGNEMYFSMPDVAAHIIPGSIVLANISVSFNGFDFTEVQQAVSEFRFYGFPLLTHFLPVWGHQDFATVITITGSGFQNNPTMNRCVFLGAASASEDPCTNPFAISDPVPAEFVSPTQIRCKSPARLRASPVDTRTYREMCVKFSPDGRLSTREAQPELYNMLLQPVGVDRFKYGTNIKAFNLSSNAIPIQGGEEYTFAIEELSLTGDRIVDNQAECMSLAGIHYNRTLRVAFVPTAGNWREIRPPGYGDVIQAEIKSILEDLKQTDILDQIQNICRLYMTVVLPVLPFPMLTELKLSYNGGQKYIGPASTVIAYRSEPPQEIVPRRGSDALEPRPQLSVFFTSNLFASKASIAGTQANALMARAPGCKKAPFVVCQTGPKCRFIIGSQVVESEAFFEYDAKAPKLVCTVPPSSYGFATVNVTLDSYSFITSPDPFQFYQQPRVTAIYPTNGYWDAETTITVRGTNFLSSDPGLFQVWCIFDFRDVFPVSDVWNVQRKWSYAVTDPSSGGTTVTCRAPPIPAGERPIVPRNPRARVGIVVDGTCTQPSSFIGSHSNGAVKCETLKNFDSILWSNGFFLYTDNPTLTSVVPVSGFTKGGLKVTIFGSGFMSSYTVGKPPGWKQGDMPALGYSVTDMLKLCKASAYESYPCPGLTCRFGNDTVQALMDFTKTFVTCDTPTVTYPLTKPLDLRVSLNGEPLEFSNAVGFTFVSSTVASVTPKSGAAMGGNKVMVHGKQYLDVPCEGDPRTCPGLVCKFTRLQLHGGEAEVIVAAEFISTEEVHCTVPSNEQMGFNPNVPTDCLTGVCFGEINIQVSVNGREFTATHGSTIYQYSVPATFTSFSPDSGSISGHTNVTVVGTQFDRVDVQCMFGTKKVQARKLSPTRVVCTTPPMENAIKDGIFVGFSTNNYDFCELVYVNGVVECEFTYATRPTWKPFFYHDPMTAVDIIPPAGWRQGGTEVHILGTGFKDYGQKLWVYFDKTPVPAQIVNSTALKVFAPPLPANVPGAQPLEYVVDAAYAVRVTSNNETYTKYQIGGDCPENLAGENPLADCSLPFVMYTWYELPLITSVKKQTSNFYPNLAQPMYSDLANKLDVPQGPVWGGTTVSIVGTGFTSWSRINIRGGNAVTPNGCNRENPCTTTCTFPYIHIIQGSQYYYSCTNLKKSTEQINYNPEEYWCAVGAAQTYSGQFGVCDNKISMWRDFNQGGKIVTNLECRFGEKFVPAMIVDNQTISCVSPPYEAGTLVPLSVTLNRKDFTVISEQTYFQYISAPPAATYARISNTGTSISLKFNVSTNMQGLQDQDRVMKPADPVDSGCTRLLHTDFVDTLGSAIMGPTCTFSPDQSMITIKIGSKPTFEVGGIVRFHPRSCEQDPRGCWYPRTQNDLLANPVVKIKCLYPDPVLSGCSNRLGHDPNWCGRCMNPATNPSNVLPPIDISYPFNASTTAITLLQPLAPVPPFATISGVSVTDDCTYICVGGSTPGIACQQEVCAENDPNCDPAQVTACRGGRCENILAMLDGATGLSGNLGRPFKTVRWSLGPESTDQSFADNMTLYDGMFRPAIPKSKAMEELSTGSNFTYCFKLTVRNWLLGDYTTPCFNVMQMRGVALPAVKIFKPASTLLSEDFQLVSQAGPSDCGGADAKTSMNYSWSVEPIPSGWDAVKKDRMSLTVPKYSVKWMPGVAYHFSLLVFLVSEEGATSTTTTLSDVTMARTRPVAVIKGGTRTVDSHNMLELSAMNSFDPDVNPSERRSEDLIYCWACMPNTSCPVSVPDGNHSMWHIDGPHVAGALTFSLTIARAASAGSCAGVAALPKSERASTSAIITIVETAPDAPLPYAMLEAPTIPYLSYSKSTVMDGYVGQGSEACISANPDPTLCSVEYEWTFDPPLSSPVAKSKGNAFGRVSINVPAFSFEQLDGLKYKITLRTTSAGGQAGAEQDMAINLGPVGGTFSVQPTTGKALSDTFVLIADGWADEDLPLKYEFSILQYSPTGSTRMPLASAQTESSMNVQLPPGNPDKNDKLDVYLTVIDALGAETPRTGKDALRVQVTSQLGQQKAEDLQASSETVFAKKLSSGDTSGVLQHLALVGAAVSHPDLSGPKLDTLKDFLVGTASSVLGAAPRVAGRRLLNSVYLCRSPLAGGTPLIEEAVTAYSSLASGGTTASCATALRDLAADAGCSSRFCANCDPDVMAFTILKIVAVCQKTDYNGTVPYTDLQDLVRYVGVLIMQARSQDFTFLYPASVNRVQAGKPADWWQSEYLMVHIERLSATLSQTTAVQFGDDIGLASNQLEIPAPPPVPASWQSFDVMVVSWAKGFNMRRNHVSTTLNSRVMSFAFRPAQLALLDTTQARTVEDYDLPEFTGTLKVLMYNDIIVSRSATTNGVTGVFRSSVCALYNTTENSWLQFGEGFKASTGALTCYPKGLSDFALIEGQVGCDEKASLKPVINNECGACNGGDPAPRQGICDWNKVPCTNGVLDKCYVCNGQNRSFYSLATMNESGSCDYQGNPCTQDANGNLYFPTACGVCDILAKQLVTRPDEGVCDCSDGGQPNGGKKRDRCSVCGGTNSTMDFCGMNPHIPQAEVCWDGGFSNVQNGNLPNFSCTGCDGVPRPDLPYDLVTGNGGVQFDNCGVCGGDGSTCVGCDLIPGSPKRFDVCASTVHEKGRCLDPGQKTLGDLATFNQSCVGCDGLPAAVPKQLDHNGVCGGLFYGVSGCDYTTMLPIYLCKRDCMGVEDGRETYDQCGVCGGDGSTCMNNEERLDDWTFKTGCRAGVFVDKCGKCGGDGSTCRGCDGVEFSGKVFDVCNVCDGDGSSCKGCDGIVNSGKVLDMCGVCDGGNLDRDVCGVCGGDDSSCAGCDGVPYSDRAVDACEECGGTNRCKWRDGNPPQESGGATDAVVLIVPLEGTGARRSGGGEEDSTVTHGAAFALTMLVAALLSVLVVSRCQ